MQRREAPALRFGMAGVAAESRIPATDESLRSPQSLRRGRELAEVIATQLHRVRSDDHVDDDALLLVTIAAGLGNGVLAGDITLDDARRLLARSLDQLAHLAVWEQPPS